MHRIVALLIAGLVLAGCSEPIEPPSINPITRFMTIAGGDAQAGAIGSTLTVEPAVVVKDASGAPVGNVEVQWRVVQGGGTTTEQFTKTDAQGRTSVKWTLGEDVGRQLLIASAPSMEGVTFRADASMYYTTIAAGRKHSCTLDNVGNAYCWGSDAGQQLGNGTAGGGVSAQKVLGGYRFAKIYGGGLHSCALTSAGQAYCWGENIDGQLGDSTQAARLSPIGVATSTRFTSLSLGSAHSCGLTSTGEVWCWGNNSFGQVGTASATCTRLNATWPCALQPLRVTLPAAATVVSAGESHTCAVLTDGRAVCWGSNNWGETGVGRFGGQVTQPEVVASGLRWKTISAGVLQTCAVSTTNEAYCWGISKGGSLGNGSTLNFAVPDRVVTEERFRSITMGETYICGLSMEGVAFCWGGLGDPTKTFTPFPFKVATNFPLDLMTGGAGHVCGRDPDAIWCWGSNVEGQLGVTVPGGKTAVPVRVATILRTP